MTSNLNRRYYLPTKSVGLRGFVHLLSRSLFAIFLISPGILPAAEIHDAAKSGNLAKVKILIEADPGLIAAKDESGRTPLHWACRGVHVEMVQYLVEFPLPSWSGVSSKSPCVRLPKVGDIALVGLVQH